MHVTPQIECLEKTSPLLRVSTHIYGVSKEIDGKTQVNCLRRKPRHVAPQINNLGKMSPVLRVSTHIYRVSKEIDQENIAFFRVNLGM